MIDTYGRKINYLRLSVTDKCNLRCRYCMPKEGVCDKKHEEILTEEEMISAIQAAANLGITKLRITGGEPLIKKNIVSICEKALKVKGIEEVCITTNGILLPQLAEKLYNAGVRRINISLDTLNNEKYNRITRVGQLKNVMDGIKAALAIGFDKIKINTVLIGGFNDDEIIDLANLTIQYPIDVRFIELMPMEKHSEFGKNAYISCSKVLEVLPHLEEKISDGVAKLYSLPNAKGAIGLISPISSHFCNMCNRIRLTADGKLKPCLHSCDEINIKNVPTEKYEEMIKQTILIKPACHDELSANVFSNAGRNMNQIGG